jgi:DNA primase
MFPLADPRGKVLGFGARAVREGPKQAKYINTSENELYHKGRQLFGIDLARGPSAKRGRILVVEGYTDVLALHQAGLTETVAIMGTAVTPEQVTLLSQTTNSVFLALDADRSGQEAMLRAAKIASERGVELRVVEMPEGDDPAELVAAEGADAFGRRIDGARLVPDFEARRVVAQADLSSPRGRDRALEQVRPLVGALPANSATRDDLVRFVADRLDVPFEYVTSNVAVAPPRTRAPREAAPVVTPAPSDAVARTERTFLAMCLSGGVSGRSYLERLTDEHFSSDALRHARRYLVSNFDDPLARLPADDPALSALVTDIAMRDEEVNERLLELTFDQLDLRRVQRLLRRAERDGDLDRQRQLAPEQVRIKNQINELMGQAV